MCDQNTYSYTRLLKGSITSTAQTTEYTIFTNVSSIPVSDASPL